jgi:hypothetical protein
MHGAGEKVLTSPTLVSVLRPGQTFRLPVLVVIGVLLNHTVLSTVVNALHRSGCLTVSIASLNTLADRRLVSLPQEEALSYAFRARRAMYLRIFINVSRTCKEIGQNL